MREQEEAEFRALVLRQSPFVFRVAYSVLRNSYDAEDVAQETFLKLYRNGAWRSMHDEKAFLARTAWRIAVDHLAARKPSSSGDPAHLELPSPAPSPEERSIAAGTDAALHRLIDSLPHELRQTLALSAIQELNSRQISEILSVPEGTVRTRLMRARQLLREKLASGAVVDAHPAPTAIFDKEERHAR